MSKGGLQSSEHETMYRGLQQDYETVAVVPKLQTSDVLHEVLSGCASYCNSQVVPALALTSPTRVQTDRKMGDVTSTATTATTRPDTMFGNAGCKRLQLQFEPEQTVRFFYNEKRIIKGKKGPGSKTCENPDERVVANRQRRNAEGRDSYQLP